jgi:hypothetical protein
MATCAFDKRLLLPPPLDPAPSPTGGRRVIDVAWPQAQTQRDASIAERDARIVALQERVQYLQGELAASVARGAEWEKEVGARGMMLEYVSKELRELQASYLLAREQLRVAADHKVGGWVGGWVGCCSTYSTTRICVCIFAYFPHRSVAFAPPRRQ